MNTHKAIRQFKRAVKDIYGSRIKQIVLYGSWARGDASEESDIDLMVVLSGEVQPGLELDRMIDVITDINLAYDVLISVLPVSEGDFNTLQSPLLLNVRQEGVPA
ncbi:MAG TPA: nucleotidyltransferase domain-containing protein [Anaerolineae bacterium]|nr:nucleotidyltransferase domain-containing protein [Anaerolineae bacterium]